MKITTLVIAAALALTACTKKEVKRPDTYNYNRAMELAENSEYDEAVKYFKKEIEKHPDNGYAHMMLGAIYKYKDNLSRAMEHANKAIMYLDEDDEEYMSGAYRLRATLFLQFEDTVKAMKDLDKSLQLYPENEDLLQVRAELYFDQERYDLSDKDYQHLIDVHPECVYGYMGRGRNAKMQGLYEKSIPYFDKAIQLADDDYACGYAFRAECRFELKQYQEAADDVVKALDIDINDGKANYLLEVLADSALTDVTARLKVQALKDKNTPNWYYCLGEAHKHIHDYSTAIKYYTMAAEVSALAVIYRRISDCYSELADYNQAIKYIDKAINLDPDNEEQPIDKAYILLYAKRYPEALDIMSHIVDQFPYSGGVYSIRSQIKERMGDLVGAVEDMDVAIIIHPDVLSYYAGRAYYNTKLGNQEKAKADWERILREDTVPKSNSVAMYAYAGLGQSEKAKKFMAKVIKNEPDDRGVYYDAACLYSRMGEYDEALKYLRKAFEKGYCDFNHINADYDMDVLREMPAFKMLIDEFRSKDGVAV